MFPFASPMLAVIAPPALPLTSDYHWTGGNSYDVAGASGTLAGYGNPTIAGGNITGGTAPYTVSKYLSGNTGCSLVDPGTGQTVGYSISAVGGYAYCQVCVDVTDSSSPPKTVSYRYPSSGSLTIHRTS